MNAREIAERVARVRARIEAAAARAGRDPGGITLVGVTKAKPAEMLLAAARAGVRVFGENYVQEALPKLEQVRAALEREGAPLPRFHFIGRLQRNKARQVVPVFDAVETLDRESLGDELQRRAEAAGRVLEVLLQVNLSGEPQKGGAPPEAVPALLEASRRWSALGVTGLMTVPAAGATPETSRPAFAKLRELAASLRSRPGGEGLHQLSMGMSGDFEVAVEEGATLVRVGTALFGPRPARP